MATITHCNDLPRDTGRKECLPSPYKEPEAVFRKKTWEDIIVRQTDFSEGVSVLVYKDGVVKGTKEAVEYFREYPNNFYNLTEINN